MSYLSPDDAKKIQDFRAKLTKECKESFAAFVRYAWCYVNTNPDLKWTWHMDIVCDHLVAVYLGKILKLVVNIPPSTGKSRLVSILFPAWVWLNNPRAMFLVATHSQNLILEFGSALVDLLKSEFYKNLQPAAGVALNVAKTNIVNASGGSWYGTTPRGDITGKHGDYLIFDDLVEPIEADAAENAFACEWVSSKWISRYNDAETVRYIGVGQRINELDPYQHCLDTGWFSLVLPARYEGGPTIKAMPNGEDIIQDLRLVIGDNLSPTRLPDDYLDDLEKLYPRVYAGQYQQRPSPAGGGIFQSAWLTKRWRILPSAGTWLLSVDAAFKGTEDSDHVVIGVWLNAGPDFYLVDQIRRKMGFWDTIAAIELLAKKYPKTIAKLIEDKANGSAIIETLQKTMFGVEAINPEGGKAARANAVSPCFAAGNVFLPEVFASDPNTSVAMYVHELEIFSGEPGKKDDQVDQTTQALTWFITKASRMVTPSRAVTAAMIGAAPDPKPVTPQAQQAMNYQAWRARQLSGRSRP